MKFITRAEALKRMLTGDLPTQGGGYTSKLIFSDGARTSAAVGHRMVRDGVIERPVGTNCDATYTLKK